jgi:hypothetical protein
VYQCFTKHPLREYKFKKKTYHNLSFISFEVFTMAILQIMFFWVRTLYNLVGRGTCCLHLQGEELVGLYRQDVRKVVTQTHRRQSANGAKSGPTEIVCKKMAHCKATILLFITGGNSDKILPFS